MSDEYEAATSPISGLVRYRLESPFLVVEHDKDGASESILLEEVSSVRLTVVQGMGLCALATSSGQKVTIASRHVRGFGDLVDQHSEYSDFVRSLHYELASAAPKARYTAGSNLMFVMSLVLLAMAGLFAVGFVAVLVAEGGVAFRRLFPLLFTVPVVAMSVMMVRRGRAKSYDPATPADEYLPESS